MRIFRTINENVPKQEKYSGTFFVIYPLCQNRHKKSPSQACFLRGLVSERRQKLRISSSGDLVFLPLLQV